MNYRIKIFNDIIRERDRQDEKWGADRDLSNFVWLTILMEEVGEISEAILKEISWKDARKELIQIAAVTIAWLEALEREYDKTKVIEKEDISTKRQIVDVGEYESFVHSRPEPTTQPPTGRKHTSKKDEECICEKEEDTYLVVVNPNCSIHRHTSKEG